MAHITRFRLPVDDVSSTPGAEEYARRLAQREISSTVLVRAYRHGQQLVLDRSFRELARREPDPQVAFTAAGLFTDLTFKYVDSISEQVVVALRPSESAGSRTRNTVRAEMLTELLAGENVDAGTAEQVLGYRLRQHHLGAVLWGADVRVLEKTLGALGKVVGACGQLLFFSRPVHRVGLVAAGSRGRHRPGSPCGRGPRHAQAITSYADPEVRTAAMLTSDMEATRRLVAKALGGPASDTEGAERLRETPLTFLSGKGSYTATAERVHLHKNTVKYRVDKAVEARGRPLDDERLELELALVARRWLGVSVLRPPAEHDACGAQSALRRSRRPARTLVQRARVELRAAGARPLESTGAVQNLLCPRGLQVALLAGDGLSSKEIGERLYRSHPHGRVTPVPDLPQAGHHLPLAAGYPPEVPITAGSRRGPGLVTTDENRRETVVLRRLRFGSSDQRERQLSWQ